MDLADYSDVQTDRIMVYIALFSSARLNIIVKIRTTNDNLLSSLITLLKLGAAS